MRGNRLKKDYLFLSGPVNIEKSIRKAVFNAKDIGHRESEFIVTHLDNTKLQKKN